MSVDERSSQSTWRLSMSSDAREALTFMAGLAGMLAILVAALVWQRPPEPLLVGACLTMMGFSLGAGLDRRARERRAQHDDSEEPTDELGGPR